MARIVSEDQLERLRREISAVDEELVRLLGRRLELASEIGRLKAERGLPVLDPGREARVVRRAAELARRQGVDPELVRDVVWRIIAQARGVQDAPESGEP